MTYTLLIKKINKKSYETKEEVQEMLDVFYIGARITKEQYEELTQLLALQ